MEKDKHKTNVKFLKAVIVPAEADEQPFTEIIAYFPDKVFDSKGNKTCYAHVGQHSAICVEFADACKLATQNEYKELQIELEELGYNLNVIN